MHDIKTKPIRKTALISTILIATVALLFSTAKVKAEITTPFRGIATNNAPIEATADDLNYDRKTGKVIAKGNVVITKGVVTLKAEYVRVNMKTETAHAYGNVRLFDGETVWTGTSLDYDFNKKTGKASGFTGSSGTFRILENESVEKTGKNTFVLHNALVTTCTNTAIHDCHYRVKAKKVELVQDDYLKVRGAKFYLGKVPCMYLPYWRRNMDDDFGWELEPGHSGRLGYFLRAAYRYRMNEVFRGKTHLDLYSERGVGVGQDLFWESHSFGTGGIETYFISDDLPVPENENPDTYGVEPERYRVKVDHFVSLSPKDSILVRGNYLSDKYILRDFFEDEYRVTPVPENDITYTHLSDNYTFNILARSRVNDFFESVNRIPEASLNFVRQQIKDSSFYYESRTSAGYIERTFAVDENSSAESADYSSGRFDTVHRIYRPSRHFGFLNLVPRAGIRGTYYSETGHTEYMTNTVAITQTNSLQTIMQTNSVPFIVSDGSGFREQFEIGMEASFKAFKIWEGKNGKAPLRHVAEPYIDFSYKSEPSLLPGDLYQFDSIDTLAKNNKIKLGMRNKLQIKRASGSANLIDIDLYTHVNFEPEGDNNSLENFVLDTEMYPTDWMRLDFDGVYNTQNSTLHTFNSRIQMKPRDKWELYLEHRHIDSVSDLILTSLTIKPTHNWHYNVYGRYEAETSRFEEGGGYIQRNFDCMVFRLATRYLPGYTRDDGIEEEDDVKVMFEFWLKAIPGLGFQNTDNRGYHGI
ncbi:MAG: LPS-assembly protein LptD [Kiritimatiellae bacterium]|nr:LPS-assembly protein LptD [Kiritimatiellia bacterium]